MILQPVFSMYPQKIGFWDHCNPGSNKKPGMNGRAKAGSSRGCKTGLREKKPPPNEQEAQEQFFASIGNARFQRMQGRKKKAMAEKMEQQQAALEEQQ